MTKCFPITGGGGVKEEKYPSLHHACTDGTRVCGVALSRLLLRLLMVRVTCQRVCREAVCCHAGTVCTTTNAWPSCWLVGFSSTEAMNENGDSVGGGGFKQTHWPLNKNEDLCCSSETESTRMVDCHPPVLAWWWNKRSNEVKRRSWTGGGAWKQIGNESVWTSVLVTPALVSLHRNEWCII